MKGLLSIFATKTVLVAFLAAADYIVKNDPTNPQTWLNAALGFAGAVSVRHAIEKNGPNATP